MSVLYCTIPHFAAALAQRDNPELEGQPVALIGPEGRVFGTSAEAHACGVVAGLSSRIAQVRCPEARLVEADVPRYRAALETLFQVLERASPSVEPHSWGSAYVDLGNQAREHTAAVVLGQQIGRAVRQELSPALQPALGWDSTKFTAQAAARRTQAGRLLAVAAVRERAFLQPLPVTLLPLPEDALQRLGFLGLRTLGQYAGLPAAAVMQQFGRAGRLAHRCARGEDDRPVLPRWQVPHLAAHCEFDVPLVERERLLSALQRRVLPLLSELRGNLQACGRVQLSVRLDDGSVQDRTHLFLSPTAETEPVMRTLERLLESMHWSAAATAVDVSLEQIQDAVVEQLALFAAETEREQKLKLVQRHLAARFGAHLLRRAVLAQPDAPLPEWRIGWLAEGVP